MRVSASCSLAAVKAGDDPFRYVVGRIKPGRDGNGDAVRLLCDEMLKGIGRWLRAAGYDTAIAQDGVADEDLLAQARPGGAKRTRRGRPAGHREPGRGSGRVARTVGNRLAACAVQPLPAGQRAAGRGPARRANQAARALAHGSGPDHGLPGLWQDLLARQPCPPDACQARALAARDVKRRGRNWRDGSDRRAQPLTVGWGEPR